MAKKKKTSNDSAELFDESSKKKLFLLDGMALIYRAHFALIRSPRFTSGGKCTSGVFGMANTVLDIINRQKPTHLAIAFDTSEPTQRHIEYPEYKAQREELPEDIADQIPLVDRFMEAMRIPVLRVPGFEADDIIGTLAHQAEEQGFEVQSANNPARAEELARSFDPHIVLLDIRLENANGLDLVPTLQGLCPDMVCFLMSGDLDDDTRAAAELLGVTHFLQKPLDFDRLVASLMRLREAA